MNQAKPETISRLPNRTEAAKPRAYRPTAIGVPTIAARATACSVTCAGSGPANVSATAAAQAAAPAVTMARSRPVTGPA